MYISAMLSLSSLTTSMNDW